MKNKIENNISKDVSEDSEEEMQSVGFTDDNKSWLKPKQKVQIVNKKRKHDSSPEVSANEDSVDEEEEEEVMEETDSEEEALEDSNEEESGEDNVNIGTLKDISGESESDSENDAEDSDEAQDNDEEMLPIEKQSKILKKKQEKEEKLAEEELQLNIANQEMFEFPSEDDDKQITNLQEVQARIKDVVMVLSDFNKLRQPDRSRADYINLLQKDLCMYYSYNEYLMEKLMQLFPLSELLEFLEASEVQRPLTIRTNNLKTRRRDLAQALINR